jgi:arachidonate 15-lipoxygenase
MATSSQDNSINVPNADSLTVARQEYQYNYTHIPPIAMVDTLPPGEDFTSSWYFLLAQQVRGIFVNTLITNRGNRGSESIRDDVRLFILELLLKGAIPFQTNIIVRVLQIVPQILAQGISRDFRELDDLLFAILKESGITILRDSLQKVIEILYEGQPKGHATSLKDYEKLFPVLGVPKIATTFQEDEVFAYMRVAGYNPVMIQRVSKPGDRFPVTEEHYQSVMGNDDSLAAAGEEGRLYVTDYKLLEGAIGGTYPYYQKYLYAPIALFAVPKGSDPNRLLRPVAIQCGQTPGSDYPIITPNSGKYAWLFAKTVVQIADANVHEAVTHLGRTHLFVGAFVLATHRQLRRTHPISILLRPHFEGTLAINDAAQRALIAPGGGVDRLLAATIDNSRVLAVYGLQSYSFNNAILSKQFKQRGVDDPNVLPVYPYRDDALLVWDAIHQWVLGYLNLYYPTDEDVKKDVALQAWVAEARSYDGGRISDFGENGAIETREYLADAITLIIFTASAQHAAVNFPQEGLMGYGAAVPLAGYAPASILTKEVSEEDYLKLLAPLDQAQRQYNLLALLSSVYYNKLGDYSQEHFTDPQVQPLLQEFQSNLKEVEATINQRNLKRPTYNYLLPSKIPQSINI